MLKRFMRAGERVASQLASLPLRMLGQATRGRILQQLLSEMVMDVSVGDAVLRFVTSSPTLYERARGAQEKEPNTIRWIDGFTSGDVLWDIGANVGVFSLYAANRPGIRVLAFEPLAENYTALCSNILRSGLTDRVVPYCVAFSGATKLGVFNSSSHEPGSSLHQFGSPGEASRYWKGSVSHVQGMIGYAIDDFLAQFEPAFPTHIKLDVDGLEVPILAGAFKTLRDPRLRSLMVELSLAAEGEVDRAMALLSDAGFICSLRGEVFGTDAEANMNHFFVRK